MAADQEMIELRSSVRKAAESKLAHGIIDVNDLFALSSLMAVWAVQSYKKNGK